ncbi:phosphoadenylyl-sulfate reductase [Sphingomonas sp. M1-B02]|uniref:phosphoadenylyl-sulfate reductase n=1 Tax=Sphingomonas sp. M1-B02 TaxID=3114300 RepID=UPI00223F01F3|nr:phosphoadenylyl-sulfate reductase [Sphingomonas sp. S6-11]UZK66737.1 phosphoadenylyl-sulfate reductase [Sphingomonas sp. S6-11]
MAELARKIDRLDLTTRFTEHEAIRLNNMFRGTSAEEMLRTVLTEQMVGDVAIVSSFGAESAALLHLVSSIDRNIPVLFLDTGRHFPETLLYRDALAERLGLTNLQILHPDAEVLAARDANRLRWSFDPDGCCEIRKVEPLARGLAGLDATITGRKAFQASTRNALPRFELDTSDAIGRLKINPLADWTRADLDAYFLKHELPVHPLVAQGYPSIGCAPCTSSVKPGEDPRAGRWRGWDKTECGIHTPIEDNDPNLPVF